MKNQLLAEIKQSFTQAKAHCANNEFLSDGKDEVRKKHACRSKLWINYLAEQLLISLKKDRLEAEEYLAFYQANNERRQLLGLNEFLFDIVIGKMTNIQTASGFRNSLANDETLKAMSHAIWIVESELKLKDSRALLVDMNKLVLGKAKNKLFVMSIDKQSRIEHWAEETLRQLTKDDEANVYLARIPHPKDWFELNVDDIEVIEI
ncbi:hypothetical protein E0H88_00160 [Acinetobacter sp. ANC 4216]|uniref:hypothetical protein n=1 Tax=Acinetobacter sp. ANC 4216 TaxID=2529840 RepID=UPI00103EE9B9|nr:hypothetical protein [Acinetobacter sp. ANC 4216]TCB72665.1 hypothetical protein E0H88_00160 [Acinetobacter sp. ANC 4216]